MNKTSFHAICLKQPVCMKEILIQITLLLSCILIVWPAHVFLSKKHIKEKRSIELEAREKRIAKIAQGWRGLNYSKIIKEDLEDHIASNETFKSLNIDVGLKQAFVTHFIKVIEYMENPTLQSYLKLKHPMQYSSSDPAPHQMEYMDKAKDLWFKEQKIYNVNEVAKLKTICLESIRFELSDETGKNVTKLKNIQKGFTYARKASELELPNSKIEASEYKYLHMSFFAETSIGFNPGPIYLSFIWVPAIGDWKPNQMFSDMLTRMNFLF